jgi:hypothetical protein
MKSIFKEIKEEVKEIGKKIKELKDERNKLFRESHLNIINGQLCHEKISKASTIQWRDLPSLKYKFRHMHIARCEMMGRTREQIEKPSSDNLPNETYIFDIKNEWRNRINETICSDEKRFVA